MATRREPAHVRKARLEAEANEIATFYNEGPGSKLIVETEGETVGEEPGADPDSSATDAAAAETALATVPIRYSVTEEQLAKLREEGSRTSFDTAEGYEAGRKLLAILRALSGAIERTRKALKAPALSFGTRVDDSAKALVSEVNEIRDPLQAAKDIEDAARERRRRAAEDAEREAIRLAEQAKLDEQRAELARIEAEQRVAREAEAAKQAEERLRLEADRAAQAADRAALESDREAMRLEREEIEAARRVVEPVGYVHPLGSRAPEILPADSDEPAPVAPPPPIDWVSGESQDSARLRSFASALRGLPRPAVDSDTAAAVLEQVEFILSEAVQALEGFGEVKEAATAAE